MFPENRLQDAINGENKGEFLLTPEAQGKQDRTEFNRCSTWPIAPVVSKLDNKFTAMSP